MDLATGSLVGQMVVILPHYTYDLERMGYVGRRAHVLCVKSCGHYALEIEGVDPSETHRMCWTEEMLQPITIRGSFIPAVNEDWDYPDFISPSEPAVAMTATTPVEEKKWYAFVLEGLDGEFTITATMLATMAEYAAAVTALDVVEADNCELLPLMDAVALMEV